MRLRGALTAAVALVAAAAGLAAPAAHAAAVPTVQRSCAWQARMDPTAVNTLYPDAAANYWFLSLPAAPGAQLLVHGLYPHARYISLTSYDPALRAVDGLNDTRIAPDAGSVNVFAPGASRTVPDAQRHYTVTVVFGQRPAQNTPDNVLYTTSADGSHTAPQFLLIYRVYRADSGLDVAGGEPLPEVSYVPPGGAPQAIPDCTFADAPDTGLNRMLADGGPASSSQVFQYPGTNPPTWHRFYNAPTSLAQGGTDNGYTGTQAGQALSPYTTTLPRGGFAENLDNAYVFTQLTRGYGNLAVVHGRLPSFPDTYSGAPLMGTGQLRYFSICSNDGPSERYYGCLADDQVPVDAAGDYTIVVSTAAARPANATAACGVGWLPAGPLSSTLLIVRNMLPQPQADFPQAIQYVRYGSEQADMGAYYPATTYTDGAAFAARGCPATAAAATAPGPSGSVSAAAESVQALANTSAAPGSAGLPAAAGGLTAVAALAGRRRRRRGSPRRSGILRG